MLPPRRPLCRPARATRAFTLMEVTIAATISTMVMIGVVGIQYIGARMNKQSYGTARTRGVRMIALDQIRFRLMNARIGSCVVGEANHRIEFVDPNLPGAPTSMFRFVPAELTLYYDDDTGDGQAARAVARGPIDVTFETEGDTVVRLHVRTASHLAYANVDTQDGDTAVYLRTPNSTAN